MPRTIRYHLDEHCDPAITTSLRLHWVEVTTTPEAGLLFARDEEQDFLRLHAARMEHRGIAFCDQQRRSIGQIIAGLLLIWEGYEPEVVANRIEFL